MNPFHHELARIGLRVADRYGFALAGGYAVQAHGFLARPSEDVDLFTSIDGQGEFATAVAGVIGAYQEAGLAVSVTFQTDTFAPGSLIVASSQS